jgi:hypothetical protein
MVTLIMQMLDLHRYLSQSKTDRKCRLVMWEIESIDQQIDSQVYGLYGLTVEEIAVVEKSILK